MTDDEYIVDEENGTSAGRSFLTAAGILALVFLLAAACSLFFLLRGRSPANPEATAIAATNSVIILTNEAVTRAIEATNTALAMPTNTPGPTEAPTQTATAVANTATPTGTAVVDTPTDTPTPNMSGTSTFDDNENDNDADNANDNSDNSNDNDNTNDNSNNATATPLPNNDNDDNGSLPETGFSSWGPIAIAALLIGLLIGARRLRSA